MLFNVLFIDRLRINSDYAFGFLLREGHVEITVPLKFWIIQYEVLRNSSLMMNRRKSLGVLSHESV